MPSRVQQAARAIRTEWAASDVGGGTEIVSPYTAARADLIAYAKAQWPGFRCAAHHRLIADKLMAVERGELKRLMIFVAPRHGKSLLASQNFPAWFLGRNPSRFIIATSYAQELAEDFGREVRNQLTDDLHRRIFPACGGARGDSKSARRFHTGAGGVYFATGIGGPITGRGAHVLLIDDPVKGHEEAESELVREKHKKWYASTAYPRLMPGGAIIVIQTRWHRDDLAGWLLKEHAHEGWDVVSLPAINERDEALWPDQYPIERLREIRKTIGARVWSSLYQQRPLPPEEAGRFREEWFVAARERGRGFPFATSRDVAARALRLRDGSRIPVFVGVDLASGRSGVARRTDLSSLFTVAYHPAGSFQLLDVQQGRWTAPELLERMRLLHAIYAPVFAVEDNGVQQMFVDLAKEDLAGMRIVGLTTTSNKWSPIVGVESMAVDFENKRWIVPSDATTGRATEVVEGWLEALLHFSPREHTPDVVMASWIAVTAARDFCQPVYDVTRVGAR
jgi:hypothetical protein